jgi:diguanylate cyclase (GGDEF)-like protein/PAS domain S-box-containing protein
VILLDIVMPGMNGFEVCRKLKANAGLRDTPVVFITAIKGDSESRIQALECGAEAFLAKPIDESELTAQIRAMVKIKTANLEKRDEKRRLAALVEERTRELQKEHLKAMGLVQALKAENEIRRRSEAALLEAKNYFELVFNTSPDAAAVTRMDDGTIVNANEGFTRLFGYTKEEAIDQSCLALRLYQNPLDRKEIVRALAEDGFCDGVEVNFLQRDGNVFVGLLSAKRILLNGVAHISSNIHNITERKRMENNLYYLSYHDYLTGLNNRRFLEQESARLGAKDMLPLSILVADINGLKLINDAFGHQQGDTLIKDTARIISDCSREADVPARTGGDEFTLMMPKTDGAAALDVQQAIQTACEAYNDARPNEAFHINVALGFATKETPEQTVRSVTKLAEKNMYQRKLLERKSMHSAILSSIKATLYEKNEETEEHGERLIDLSRKVGRILGLSQKEMDELEILSTLHDIGKVGISEQILMKPGRLTEDEWIEMKKHPQIGYRIANASPELSRLPNTSSAITSAGTGPDTPRACMANRSPCFRASSPSWIPTTR